MAAGYDAADQVWVLQSIDGERFSARADLSFPETGKIAGQAPCNRFSGKQTAKYPGFKAGPLAVTRMACPDLPAEAAFLQALEAMNEGDLQSDTLILRNGAGREMVFKSET